MRQGITLSGGNQGRFEAVVADRNSPQRHVWRARIVLLAAEGLGTAAIMRQSGKGRNAAARSPERYQIEGVAGLLRDETRPSQIPPLPPAMREHTVALTLADPPGEATHWTAAMMAKAAGVQRQSGPADLAHLRIAAASGAAVQAVARSAVRGQAQRHCRPLRRSAVANSGVVGR